MHSPLTFSEKTQLNAHLILCKWCMAYEKKAQFLHQALQNMVRKKEPEASIYNIDNKQLKEEVLKKNKKIIIFYCQDFVYLPTIVPKGI